ncbi:glutamine synthetase, type I [Ignisphaera aggregans DSM 17230]|uniref:Glutamine synthetase n=1 Tax=Ignisphaera aggregans (strain DSM 17230 / JCM 13409 / AQ1.S1) TaxID=583356 RepID=E0STY7_IGNAA|nr:glutamine synthetase, type I [Ignisphaera aggregans DSM 17230]
MSILTIELIERVKSSRIRWLDLQFTDLLGYLRHVTISTDMLTPDSVRDSLGKLDGSSVKGFVGVEESDLVLKPFPETFALIPWVEGLGRVICGVYFQGDRLSRDPRYVAEKIDSMLVSQGLKPFVSAELEFYIFDKVSVSIDSWRQFFEIMSSEAPWNGTAFVNRTKDGYYSVYPKDRFYELKMEIGDVLKKYFGIDIEVVHHEVAAASQHEINFRGGMTTWEADAIQTVKFVVRAMAFRKGYIATFMPKPIYGDNGSGMHVHVSIWRGDDNLFYDENDGYAHLSEYARYFIGGLIEHGRALSAIVNPTVNSYKRLVPGYEAPIYLVWSRGNRSAAIRVPMYSNSKRSIRIEYRPPDPSANPYLALVAILLAGLDGVKKKISPGDPVDENIYKLSPERRKALGVKELPRSLDEALDELESDYEWLKPIFSQDLIESYIELKREEARKIMSYPTPIEIYHYLDV